jgi:hypothetical protein
VAHVFDVAQVDAITLTTAANRFLEQLARGLQSYRGTPDTLEMRTRR